MPKKFEAEVKNQAIQMVVNHLSDFGSLTAASAAIGAQLGVGRETIRRWVTQADIDAGRRDGVSSQQRDELRRLHAENQNLRETNAILTRASTFLRGGTRPPQALIVAFIDEMRAAGFAVESICAVLSEHGCRIAARTYRQWRSPNRAVADRAMRDAAVIDALLATDGTPQGGYGRRRMTAYLRSQGLAVASCTVDRLMGDLGLSGRRRV